MFDCCRPSFLRASQPKSSAEVSSGVSRALAGVGYLANPRPSRLQNDVEAPMIRHIIRS